MDQTSTKASPPKDLKEYMQEFDRLCNLYLVEKAPFSLPDNWKNTLVTIMAYLNVIGIVLAIPALLALLGVSALLAPVGVMSGATLNPMSSIMGIVTIVFTLGGLILSIMAAPGLFKRQKVAWTYSYYSVLLSAVHSLVRFDIGGLVIGGLIGLYLLYQIRPKFVN